MNQEMEVLKEQSRKVQRERDIENCKLDIFLFSTVTLHLQTHTVYKICKRGTGLQALASTQYARVGWVEGKLTAWAFNTSVLVKNVLTHMPGC